MKLNADVGEGAGHDEALFRWIDLANIACGGHAGSVDEMRSTVDLAMTYGVAVGAHPGYPDRENFGRKSMPMQAGEIKAIITDQVGALGEVCRELGAVMTYVKPHGALYHDMMRGADVLEEIVEAVAEFSNPLPIMVMAKLDNSLQKQVAGKFEVPLLFEAFADRAYTDEGELMDRSLEGSVHDSSKKMITQAMQLTRDGSVTSVSGRKLPFKVDTICVHGDNEASVAAAKEIYQALRS
ncbi:MAG: 5-oxoprolinase subunit PxpA [Akkermansiaceae bacterium]